jgi:hypothetical protein
MLLAEARVLTDRSSRYLVQLCRHVSQLSQAHPQSQAQADWSDSRGVISFGSAQCTLSAEPGVLILYAEARDEVGLQQIERRVADRLEQIGRRDGLAVTWTPPRHKADYASCGDYGSNSDSGSAPNEKRTGG